jgi:sulfur-oxidizing protein SoxX
MPGSRRPRARCLGSIGLLLLTGAGDPVRGEAVVTRQSSTCTLCHAGPFPNPHLQGNVGPDLRGVGARLSPAELRERLMDASRVNPDTVMPSFFRTEGLVRVGAPWRGKPILSAGEIEDAVAYLATLK